MNSLDCPYNLLTNEILSRSLQNDKGKDAILKSWVVEDFTKKGDNYTSIVTCVKCCYTIFDQNNLVSYIVKMNSNQDIDTMQNLTQVIFTKETQFFEILVPHLNECLTEAGQVHLRIPKCLYYDLTPGKELMVLRDLRDLGFKMNDRKIGLNVAHSILIIQELARLHASSILFQQKKIKEDPNYDMKEAFSFLNEVYTGEGMKPDFIELLLSMFDCGVEVAAKCPGYEKVVEWIKRQNTAGILCQQLSSTYPFRTICHGDCWINNVLFRYGIFFKFHYRYKILISSIYNVTYQNSKKYSFLLNEFVIKML